MYRATMRFSALAVTAAILLFSGSGIAGGSGQKPDEQTEASLLTTADAIPDVGVVLKKKPERQFAGGLGKMHSNSPQKPAAAASKPIDPKGQSTSNKKTNKDGSFSFENVPPGTYNLTFEAPTVSPAMAGKVEYLVIVQQVEATAGNSATQTYDDSKPKTARIPITKIKDGLDFTVGPPPPGNVFQASKPNTKKKSGAPDSQTGQPPPAMVSTAPPPMNLRGKIFLVEIGTTRIVRDQPGVRSPN